MNNLELMWQRLEHQGGVAQEDRMIKDKYKTFLKTLKYSYQGCDVQLTQKCKEPLLDDALLPPESPQLRALINPDKNKPDYDDKILSIDYNTGFSTGDVFYWVNTKTYWLIYLKQLIEDAYFRGEIRRCNYWIKFRDEDGKIWKTPAAIRGPVETQINSIQKNQVRIDEPNLSLSILMPRNEQTEKAFKRYQEFILEDTCWRVEAFNLLSPENILEVNAEEYYINRETDDVNEQVKDGLIIIPENPNKDSSILGETYISPQITWTFTAPAAGHWAIVEQDRPVEMKCHGQTVDIVWKKMTSGSFTLHWWDDDGNDTTRVVFVESLF